MIRHRACVCSELLISLFFSVVRFDLNGTLGSKKEKKGSRRCDAIHSCEYNRPAYGALGTCLHPGGVALVVKIVQTRKCDDHVTRLQGAQADATLGGVEHVGVGWSNIFARGERGNLLDRRDWITWLDITHRLPQGTQLLVTHLIDIHPTVAVCMCFLFFLLVVVIIIIIVIDIICIRAVA